jgi:hypothetical protein
MGHKYRSVLAGDPGVMEAFDEVGRLRDQSAIGGFKIKR